MLSSGHSFERISMIIVIVWNYYSKFINNIVERTWTEFLCAVPDNRMACIGDSGGALECQGFLFGITSHGYNYYPKMSHFKTKCGDSRVQTRYLFVYNYQKWINNILDETSSAIRNEYSLFVIIFWLSLWWNYVIKCT